ncbi:hypothetical protein [Photobacterium satsumensis]|uniref:hypothetical protein n=1 Tax=Photobacterium satsumensis TaxID=2910239 RepID=UPI003D10CD56
MKRVLYIPGLGQDHANISVKSYALRMMKALDEHHPEPAKTYRIESGEKEYDSDGSLTNIVSIFEHSDNKETETYRFYEFRYAEFLTGKYRESNVFARFLSLFLALLTRSVFVLKSIVSPKDEISSKSKAQALYFSALYMLLALYLIFLIPSLLSVLITLFEGQDGTNNWSGVLAMLVRFEGKATYFLATFSAFMLFAPNSKSIFTDMAIEYLSANQYLSVGDRRLLITGKINRLIEVIAEEDQNVEIEVHAYSFGSVLAIDTIFPCEAEPNVRIQSTVTRLVTIGCPFDFIEIYWPRYFSERNYSSLQLKGWVNIYSDLDVLSSRFDGFVAKKETFICNDELWQELGKIDVVYNMVNPSQVSITKMMMFYGFKAHQNYWDSHSSARSCLTHIV